MEEYYINVSGTDGVLFSTRSVPSHASVMATYKLLSDMFPVARGFTISVFKQEPKPPAKRIATTQQPHPSAGGRAGGDMNATELISEARRQLTELDSANRQAHDKLQERVQALFLTVNKLTALGYDAKKHRSDDYDPTCDLCRSR